jgi:hypothetical protein
MGLLPKAGLGTTSATPNNTTNYGSVRGESGAPSSKAPADATATPATADKAWAKTGAAKGRPVDAAKAANDKIVQSWSNDWTKTLKTPPPAQMQELKSEAVDAVKTAQANFTKENGSVKRAQHAHALYATTQGKLKVPDNVPEAIAKGPFTPGAELRALVRISSVSGTVQKDGEKDLRGFALRLTDDKGHVQDLMMNTSEAFMAKDAQGAIVGVRVRGQGPAQLAKAVLTGDMSLGDAIHLAKAGKEVLSNNTSVAAHTFWSRTPFQLGDKAVKLRLVPVDPHSNQPLVHGNSELTDDMRMRLQHEPVKYLLQVQGYMNERDTPMNDATKPWKSDFVTVGELTLPQLPKDEGAANAKIQGAEGEIDSLAYSIANRWTKDDSSLKGLGDINAIREQAYKASAEGRGVTGTNGMRCPLGYG